MLFFRPLLVLIETNMEESVTYVTLDPQNTITSISQMNDNDKTASRQPQPFKDLSNHIDTPTSSQESQRGAPSMIEFKLEVEVHRDKFGKYSLNYRVLHKWQNDLTCSE